MNDLETIANKFKEWRGSRRHYRYPKHFWDEIKLLSKHYPLPVIASAFGINLPYLQQKIPNNSESLTFVPLQIVSSAASIEFVDRNSQKMTVHLQASRDELVHIIISLAGRES
jgi:hypothetical protein